MPGLVLEGGTFRPVFSCGVMDALLDHGVMFDYVIGVSAGITYAMSYLSRQRGRNLEVLTTYRGDKRYIGARNLVRDHSLFGVDFVFQTIPSQLIPFDWDTFNKYNGNVLVGVTNAETGKIEYLDGKQLDKPSTMLRATCAIPFYFPVVMIDGTPYYDGGLADPIPIVRSLHDGNEKNLIVLTQPDEYRKTVTRGTALSARALRNKYPNLSETMLARAKHYNETVCFCRQLVKKQPQNTVLLQPEHKLESFEKDINKLQWGYDMGYRLACDRMDDILALFS
ncbi:patatin-like phospholipase family protein [Butyricicoccus sp. Marseille-Q5471]|uniref:patatin-like phospholipase family protein n=1 Tax=Butyricicoccus sp. Marseille-Q5471 TaxID=3039493 RepID=UPI0024BC0616|nr:patatin family protein [Butyricicoccus sp. Marseille-Q5471]